MVRTCTAYGCKERFVKGGPVTFHKFPKDEKMRKLWEIKIRRQDFKATDSSNICSKHFTADCFDVNKFGGTWLKKNAVPTIFDFSDSNSSHRRKTKLKVEENTDIHCESSAREDIENDTNIKKEGNIDIHSGSSVEENMEYGSRRFCYMGDFKESDMNSPKLALMFYKIANSVKEENSVKIKRLFRKNRRLQKQVESSKQILGDTKKKKSLVTDTLQETVIETPSPQIVGREFIRQYYTLLSKAPLHLHRFYKDDSIFLHQGLDQRGQEARPVVGQEAIQERIKQLGFRNCCFKIIQFDSLDTVDNGVVVFVTGELFNNGGPMRRFTQTFVLVFVSPKRYFVRNDIFRYQDEILSEDNNAVEDSVEVAELKHRAEGLVELIPKKPKVETTTPPLSPTGELIQQELAQEKEETTPKPLEKKRVLQGKEQDRGREPKTDTNMVSKNTRSNSTLQSLPASSNTGTNMVSKNTRSNSALQSLPASSNTDNNMVSKNTRSNPALQNLPASSNTASSVSNLPSAHKLQQDSVFKTEGISV